MMNIYIFVFVQCVCLYFWRPKKKNQKTMNASNNACSEGRPQKKMKIIYEFMDLEIDDNG